MQPGGAGRDDGQVGPGETKADRYMARDHVDDRRRHKKGRDAARATLAVVFVGLLDQGQATNARTHHAADALGAGFIQRLTMRQPGIGHGLRCSGNAIVDEGIHMPRLFGRHVLLDVKALDLAGNLAGERRSVELGDPPNARLPRHQGGPTFCHRIAHRADEAQAGNDDSAPRHAWFSPSGG